MRKWTNISLFKAKANILHSFFDEQSAFYRADVDATSQFSIRHPENIKQKRGYFEGIADGLRKPGLEDRFFDNADTLVLRLSEAFGPRRAH